MPLGMRGFSDQGFSQDVPRYGAELGKLPRFFSMMGKGVRGAGGDQRRIYRPNRHNRS
jgi:hypothetical protein